MIVKILERVGVTNLQPQTVRIVRVFDYNVPSGINASLLTVAGSMIVASAAGVAAETGAPSGDGLVWKSNLALPLKGSWQAVAGGGGDVDMTNKSGSDQTAGTVVINDYTNNAAFTTTTTDTDRRVIGVLSEDILNNATGKVGVAGKILTVKVTGNVTRGQWLVPSSTAGRARAAGYTRPPGAIGMAMTEYLGGGTGTVTALLSVDMYLGASAGKGYFMGGFTTVQVNVAQILNFVNETTALTSGANLSLARERQGGGAGSTAGYTIGGYTGANSAVTDKTTLATDTTAAQASANLTTARRAPASIQSTLAIYVGGGFVAAVSALTDKLTLATDITAALASGNLSAARQLLSVGPMQSSTAGYFSGGNTAAVSAVTDKMPFATDTTAAQVSANLSVARSSSGNVNSSLAGYIAGGLNGGGSNVTTGDKLTFGTDTTVAVAGTNLSTARNGQGGASGSLAGYIGGGNTGSVSSIVDKVTYSTDTTAVASGAALPTALQLMATFANPN